MIVYFCLREKEVFLVFETVPAYMIGVPISHPVPAYRGYILRDNGYNLAHFAAWPSYTGL